MQNIRNFVRSSEEGAETQCSNAKLRRSWASSLPAPGLLRRLRGNCQIFRDWCDAESSLIATDTAH